MPTAAKATSWLFKMSHEKQDTLLKMTVLTMASILCEVFNFLVATFGIINR